MNNCTAEKHDTVTAYRKYGCRCPKAVDEMRATWARQGREGRTRIRTGGDTGWSMQDSVNLSAQMVARDGHRMPLRGAEREAAIRLMVELGIDRRTIAERLCLTPGALTVTAERHGITLPARTAHWSVAVAYNSQAPERVRARKQTQRERAAA